LLGQDGFQRHVPTGIEYLTHHSVRHHEEAAVIIAETLPLEELLRFEQECSLHRAAVAGSSAAQVKLGTRLCTRPGGLCAGLRWFEIADAAGHPGARSALISLTKPLCHRSLLAVLQAVCASGEANAEAIALVAAREALAEGNLAHLTICLQVSLALSSSLTAELGELVVCAIGLAERLMLPFEGITASQAEACLEMRANRGDR